MNKYITEVNRVNNGVQKVYQFENGYGASVISHDYSYGGKKGLWELAILDSTGSLCYDTGITEDVVGYLNDPEVDRYLRRIQQL